MFKDIQVTLYDIFGYLLPGAVLLLAVALVFWTLFWPRASLNLPSTLPALAMTTMLFAAYLVGHLTQAIGNLLEKVSPGRAKLDEEVPVSPELGMVLIHAVTTRFGEHTKSLEAKELYHLCDQTFIHCGSLGSLGEREIFTYREGFYRGTQSLLRLYRWRWS